MPKPTEAARKVFEGLSDLTKKNLQSYGLGFPEDNPDLSVFTCADCPSVAECKLAFDAYNMNGDCLAVK